MISIPYDFHIHSCLSPCADDDMTPANIIGMAAIKGLRAIAITDHNSCLHCKTAMELGERYGIVVIPGMELTTREEVHVLCLFEQLKDALQFDAYVQTKLLHTRNDPKIFGKQIIMDDKDCESGEFESLLIQATSISFDDVYPFIKSYGGIMVPAHIDKSSNSLLSNLGFIPPTSQFSCVEIRDGNQKTQLLKIHPYLQECVFIKNSDAHRLSDMNEPVHYLKVNEVSRKEILRSLCIPKD